MGEEFIWLTSYILSSQEARAGTQWRNPQTGTKAGNKQGGKQLSGLLPGLAKLSYIAWGYQPGDGTAHSGLLHQSAVKKMLLDMHAGQSGGGI